MRWRTYNVRRQTMSKGFWLLLCIPIFRSFPLPLFPPRITNSLILPPPSLPQVSSPPLWLPPTPLLPKSQRLPPSLFPKSHQIPEATPPFVLSLTSRKPPPLMQPYNDWAMPEVYGSKLQHSYFSSYSNRQLIVEAWRCCDFSWKVKTINEYGALSIRVLK